MAKDPVCGMVVEESPSALHADLRGTTFYFCSESCMHEFLAPEKELRELKLEVLSSGLLSIPILLLSYISVLPIGPTHYALFLLESPIQFVVGWRFYRGTYDGLKSRMGNMDVLIALGTSAAWAYSTAVTFAPSLFPYSGVYFDTSAVIITLVLTGRYLEHVTKSRASASVRKLAELRPTLAHKVDADGTEVEVPIERVVVGDILVVRPGEKIPVDSIIIEGSSAVDQAMITGESVPVEKSEGQEVFGGTINQSGLLRLRADKVGTDTTLSQIVRLVEEAQVGKAPIQRLADTIASYFVPVVVTAAALASLTWYYFGHIGLEFSVLVFVSVVVISCPCALGVATPAALLVGTSKGAQNGILIKDGRYLEEAGRLDAVVFDKTGTLTVGKPSVTDVVSMGAFTRDEVLQIAGSAERGSEHPLARAIVREAAARSVSLSRPTQFEALPGKGVIATVEGASVVMGNRSLVSAEGGDLMTVDAGMTSLEEQGKTCVALLVDGKVAGLVALADTLKPTARSAVDALKKMGIRVLMLTGDNRRTAAAIARGAGIDSYVAEIQPGQKEKSIVALQQQGKAVGMVGDGINDAPALARADVGMAIGSGTDIAKETGGVILITDDPRSVVTTIELSRKTLSKIKQNLFWAFAYNVVLIPVAAGALVPFLGPHIYGFLPFLAAAAMAVSSVTVIANSLLLFRFKPHT
jgi:P-type Cu+ transporter